MLKNYDQFAAGKQTAQLEALPESTATKAKEQDDYIKALISYGDAILGLLELELELGLEVELELDQDEQRILAVRRVDRCRWQHQLFRSGVQAYLVQRVAVHLLRLSAGDCTEVTWWHQWMGRDRYLATWMSASFVVYMVPAAAWYSRP
ncbi:hypothetical protein B0T26DRAFT_681970 [Lasiosphaeria miniovina]|uniref:Uncharacterized protein n=1 Tax=Lasiosphaeria miniovina TaxID=1954250 RepID=A0AA39ZQN7_9PEZI|nr:uncharacterized protein B0T26DRAFT_681970 [Lasiosphaeria miniovina]KAK0701867.1 hypothetical protein B0T26DRAFT_681970 [Lasiosphaeria miniovina]